jgi:ATP-dependent Clp protease adaptor protein ClpS
MHDRKPGVYVAANLTSPIRAPLRMFSSRRISDGTTRISCNAADRLLIEGMGQHSVGGRASLVRTQMSENGKRGEEGPGTGVVVKTKPKTKKPSTYKVLMLNDDYTPREFVVHILERFFKKSRQQAIHIMLHVHQRGVGICGVYTYEVAETKVTQVMDFARQHQHPLQCTLEKD